MGPAVLIVGSDNQVAQMSMGAELRLGDLISGAAGGDPMAAVASLVGGARRYARGETTTPPRCRAPPPPLPPRRQTFRTQQGARLRRNGVEGSARDTKGARDRATSAAKRGLRG